MIVPLLNSVKGFEPASMLIDVSYPDGRTEKYLPVAARVMWALAWAEEKEVMLTIDEEENYYDAASKQMVSTCAVRINGEVVSRVSAGKYFDPEHMQTFTPIQDACTAAKGRALANMGFSTAACGICPEHKDDAGNMFNIRKVKNFYPEDYLINLADPADPQAVHKYLEVKYRVLWALLWACENKSKIRFEEKIDMYDPNTGCFICSCNIVDGENHLLASGRAGKLYNPAMNITDTPIQNACTSAKGRALANLGFGTFYGYAEEGDTSVPCDAGIPTLANNPFAMLAAGKNLSDDKNNQPNDGDASAEKTPQPAVRANGDVEPQLQRIPMTLEQAQAYVIKKGQYKDKTVGELNATDAGRKYLKYYCDPKNGAKNLMLWSAALTIADYFPF